MTVRSLLGPVGAVINVAISCVGIIGAIGLSGCQSMPKEHASKDALEFIIFNDVPSLEKTGLLLGGFSGLVFEGFSRISGEYDFTTHTDRGPTLDVRKESREKNLRPFVDPEFVPRLISFSYDAKTHSVGHIDQVNLTNIDTRPMTGLPNIFEVDETPIDQLGHRIGFDKQGINPKALAKDSDGTYWMGDGYRPSILHFTAKGRLLQRWIPKDAATGTGVPMLPHWYAQRRLNSGFEGIAVDGDQVFAFLQSPLKNDSDVTRVLAVAKSTGQPLAEYAYEFENSEEGRTFVDKIGDAVNIGPGRFLVVEQNNAVDERGFHRVYEINVSAATNMLSRRGSELSKSSLCSDETSVSKATCVKPVKKKLVADLVALGLHGFDKLEGLTVLDSQTLALVNDNGFDVTKVGSPSAFFIVRLAAPLNLK